MRLRDILESWDFTECVFNWIMILCGIGLLITIIALGYKFILIVLVGLIILFGPPLACYFWKQRK